MDESWQLFDDVRFPFTLRYPNVTPSGFEVQKLDYMARDAQRVHFLSKSREIYVEVTKYPETTPEEEYARHRPNLEQRWEKLSITELEDAEFASRPAKRYVFRWPEGERVVMLIPAGGALYRVLWDTASVLNPDVLATFEFRS
jgi:hypothetical protein